MDPAGRSSLERVSVRPVHLGRTARLNRRERLIADISEVALEVTGLKRFRRAVLPMLAHHFGADHATSVAMAAGLLAGVTEWPLVAGAQEDRIAGFLLDIQPQEFTAALSLDVFRDDDVFSARRRREFSMFTEFLPSLSIRGSGGSAWTSGTAFSCYTLGIGGTSSLQRFFGRLAADLPLVRKVLATADRLHMLGMATVSCDAPTFDGLKLTRAEREILALVQRGLTNPEIAQLRGMSKNTVRNRLSNAFAKMGVTRRAEAVFVLDRSNWIPKHLT
jgi:DNA-binding CsgD family transcriptional regulator